MRGFFILELLIVVGLLWIGWRLLRADAKKLNEKINEELKETK